MISWLNTHADIIIATISPYSPIASAKININIIPTKIPSVYAYALTPASPATPMAKPDANALIPQHRPAPNILNPSCGVASIHLAPSKTATIKP